MMKRPLMIPENLLKLDKSHINDTIKENRSEQSISSCLVLDGFILYSFTALFNFAKGHYC